MLMIVIVVLVDFFLTLEKTLKKTTTPDLIKDLGLFCCRKFSFKFIFFYSLQLFPAPAKSARCTLRSRTLLLIVRSRFFD